MKSIKYIVGCCMAFMMYACNTLDVPPMNIVTEQNLFSDQVGVTAYMAKLYSDLPITDRADYGGASMDRNAFESLTDDINSINSPAQGDNRWYNYSNIRAANTFLEGFPAYKNLYSEAYVNAWMGEAYFVRAVCYFRMVKCLGGVPIVDRVLNYPEQSIEELKLPRNKEADCYDFILKDLDEAIRLLPETSEATVGLSQGRVNRYVALAFKARVALFAASIAKYGGETLAAYASHNAVQKGLVGVPAEKANAYYNAAWSAAKAIEDGGKYELYGANVTGEDAIVKSYRKLFQDVSTANKEVMFAKYFKYGVNAIILSANCLPYQLGGTYNFHNNATVDFVKLFDDAEGNPVDWNARFGNDDNYSQHLFANPASAFADMEPRFKAILAYPNCTYKGEVIEIRKGILEKGAFVDGAKLDFGNVRVSTDMATKYEDMTIQGKSGMGFTSVTSTGFYLIKYINEEIARADVSASNPKDETPMVELRYAEVLLMLAEAAVELGRPNDAIPYLNAIRKRAGSKKVFTTVTLDDVRRERRMELVWECQTYWDMRRWRTFHKNYDNTARQIMWPIYVFDKDAYYLRILDTGESNSKRWTFNSQYYYSEYPNIAQNDKLEQNPGY